MSMYSMFAQNLSASYRGWNLTLNFRLEISLTESGSDFVFCVPGRIKRFHFYFSSANLFLFVCLFASVCLLLLSIIFNDRVLFSDALCIDNMSMTELFADIINCSGLNTPHVSKINICNEYMKVPSPVYCSELYFSRLTTDYCKFSEFNSKMLYSMWLRLTWWYSCFSFVNGVTLTVCNSMYFNSSCVNFSINILQLPASVKCHWLKNTNLLKIL